jgi:hypothetical protein
MSMVASTLDFHGDVVNGQQLLMKACKQQRRKTNSLIVPGDFVVFSNSYGTNAEEKEKCTQRKLTLQVDITYIV